MSYATVNGPQKGSCPQCGSTDTTSLKMIVANGTTRGISHGTTTGWVDGSGNQPGHSATFSTTQRTTTLTAAARAAKAPSKRWNGVILIVMGVAVGGFGGWVGNALAGGGIGSVVLDVGIALAAAAVLIVCGLALAVNDAAYNRDVFPVAVARWSISWQCQKCGTVFQV